MVSFQSFAILTVLASVVRGVSLIPALKSDLNSAESNLTPKGFNVKEPVIVLSLPNPNEKPVPGDSPIVQCDALESQLLTLESVIIDPNPPVKGNNLTFIAKGYIDKDIEEGAYVDVDVRYGFIRLIHQTFDLCEEIQKVDLECPIKKGQQVVIKQVEIPNEVPPGKYIVNARAYTNKDELITCVSATVEFPQ